LIPAENGSAHKSSAEGHRASCSGTSSIDAQKDRIDSFVRLARVRAGWSGVDLPMARSRIAPVWLGSHPPPASRAKLHAPKSTAWFAASNLNLCFDVGDATMAASESTRFESAKPWAGRLLTIVGFLFLSRLFLIVLYAAAQQPGTSPADFATMTVFP
jgi:hypothetical protein